MLPTDAGLYGEWVRATQRVVVEGGDAAVPCGDCRACCTSGQLIHVEPDERAHLPDGALDAAGYLRPDDRGRCPMLDDGTGRCTIYEHRPRVCRTYDCRVFPAAGVEPDLDKPAIAERASQWRFAYEDDDARRRHEATRLAAVVIRTGQTGARPSSATQLAAAAVLHHDDLL